MDRKPDAQADRHAEPIRHPDRDRDRDRDRERIRELEGQLAELETLYRVTPVAFCVVDRELRYLRVNDEYAEIVARRRKDIIGYRMEEIVHPKARDVAVGMVQSVIHTRRSVRNLELPGVTRTDPPEDLVWLLNAHPILTDGEVSAVIGVMQNVTPVKRSEREAREHLDLIDSLFRNAPIGLAYVGADFRYERVNEVIAQINGIPVEAHIGRSIDEILPGHGADIIGTLQEMLAQGRSLRDIQTELAPPSDLERTHVYRTNIEPFFNEDGSPRGILATVLDVTERAQAERALKEANARDAAHLRELEALYRYAPIGMAQLDRDLRILRGSQVLAHTLALGFEEMVGHNLRDLIPKLCSQLDPALEHLLATGRQQLNVEVRGGSPRHPDREYTWLMSLYPTFGERGQVDGMILAGQDITPIKRQQAELAEVKARLEEAQRIHRIGAWEWNLLTDTVWWSDELYEIMGKSPERFTPTWNRFTELVHPDDISKLRAQIEATLERCEPYWLDIRVRLDDLTERTMRSAAHLKRGLDGRPERLSGTCQELYPSAEPPTGQERSTRARTR